jgi:hypothetical protein
LCLMYDYLSSAIVFQGNLGHSHFKLTLATCGNCDSKKAMLGRARKNTRCIDCPWRKLELLIFLLSDLVDTAGRYPPCNDSFLPGTYLKKVEQTQKKKVTFAVLIGEVKF